MLQAVPILGFFPAAIFFFIRLFHGAAAGVEAAAVFLIFTSQAWNMAFSVYESLTTIPDDIAHGGTGERADRASRCGAGCCCPRACRGWSTTACSSWAGGWYFLIASEIIAVGRSTWVLPGLGSFIGESIAQGRHGLAAVRPVVAGRCHHVAAGRASWSPLEAWAAGFRYETSAGGRACRAVRARPAQAGAARPPGARQRRDAARGQALGWTAAAASHVLSRAWVFPLTDRSVRSRPLSLVTYGAVETVEVLRARRSRQRLRRSPPPCSSASCAC